MIALSCWANGLYTLRNGEEKQASTLDWRVRTVLRLGCCGVVIFAWTDKWYHGKYLVEDWNFGLTTRDRLAKPALRAVRRTHYGRDRLSRESSLRQGRVPRRARFGVPRRVVFKP